MLDAVLEVVVVVLAITTAIGWIAEGRRRRQIQRLSERIAEYKDLMAGLNKLTTYLHIVAHDLRGNPVLIEATRQAVNTNLGWDVTVAGEDFHLGGAFRQIKVRLVNGRPALILQLYNKPTANQDHIYPSLEYYEVETY